LTIRRFEAAGLTWPLADDITDTELEARLFASAGAGPGTRRGHRRQAEPDWAAVHRELKCKHVTLSIVWEEYIAGEPGGYRYSRFCELYRAWVGRLSVTMRQSHAAGDKLFVDYAVDACRSFRFKAARRHGAAKSFSLADSATARWTANSTQHRTRYWKLCAVVADNRPGPAAHGDQKIELPDGMLSACLAFLCNDMTLATNASSALSSSWTNSSATVGEYRQLHLRYKPADTRLLLESRRAAWHCGGHLWDRNSHGNYLPRPNGLPEVRSELVLELYGSLRTGWREISSSPAGPDHGRRHAAEQLGHPARRP
jgi:hypothetical protein